VTDAADRRSGLAERIAGLSGWRRRLLSFLLGAFVTAALPPAHVLPVLIVGFVGLLWLLDGCRGARGAFAVGWWFGLGYFATSLYWVSFALLTDAARFGWMVPFAVLGLGGGLALFPALAAAAHWAIRPAGWMRPLSLAVFWTAAEWLRGTVLTGFPWNLIGQVWTVSDATIQGAAVAGIYGLSVVTVVAAALPARFFEPAPARHRIAALIVPALMVGALWSGGAVRLDSASAGVVDGVRLRLVQPDIPQSQKWDDDRRDGHLLKTVELSRETGWQEVTHVVWPETAVPFFLNEDPVRRSFAAHAAPPGSVLLTGAPRIERNGPNGLRIWNSFHAIASDGTIMATYDKVHLVPFGEYVPFRSVLPLEKIAVGAVDFSAGSGLLSIDLPGLPAFTPLICYEGIFPGAVTPPDGRPGWLLNITNDAWFGISAGPHQHFAAVRVRAVEEGLPLVRVANNGISAVVDAYGRVLARLPLGEAGFLDSDLPVAITPPLAARGNLLIPWLLAAAAMILFLISRIGGKLVP